MNAHKPFRRWQNFVGKFQLKIFGLATENRTSPYLRRFMLSIDLVQSGHHYVHLNFFLTFSICPLFMLMHCIHIYLQLYRTI